MYVRLLSVVFLLGGVKCVAGNKNGPLNLLIIIILKQKMRSLLLMENVMVIALLFVCKYIINKIYLHHFLVFQGGSFFKASLNV